MIRCACPRCIRADNREAWGAWQGELFGDGLGSYQREKVVPFGERIATLSPPDRTK